MMPVPDSQAPVEFFHENVNRAGKIFLLTAIALFGVMCLLGFFQRFPYLGADEWLIGIAGVALLVFDFLLWRYFRKPRLILSDSGMTESRLFGQREFRYADFVSLAGYVEKIYPTGPNGTSSVPLFLHRLLVRTRDGRERMITLPAFGYNGALVDALAARSGMAVERLPDRERKR
jgi:hypothetical protein